MVKDSEIGNIAVTKEAPGAKLDPPGVVGAIADIKCASEPGFCHRRPGSSFSRRISKTNGRPRLVPGRFVLPLLRSR
jgi:hypothetical protein